jgi:hypothetical protein
LKLLGKCRRGCILYRHETGRADTQFIVAVQIIGPTKLSKNFTAQATGAAPAEAPPEVPQENMFKNNAMTTDDPLRFALANILLLLSGRLRPSNNYLETIDEISQCNSYGDRQPIAGLCKPGVRGAGDLAAFRRQLR